MAAFLTDECFSGRYVRALRSAGFDISRAVDVCPGANDVRVLAHAYDHNRVLLTEDYDFGDLCIRFAMPTRGVVIVAVKNMAIAQQGVRVVDGLSELGERVLGAYVTIEPARIRLRPLR